MTQARAVLRLHIPVDGLTDKQQRRAVRLGNRVEAKVADWLAEGADPDRLMNALESYFSGE